MDDWMCGLTPHLLVFSHFISNSESFDTIPVGHVQYATWWIKIHLCSHWKCLLDQKIHWTFGVLGGCHPYPYVNQFTSSWGRKCSSMMRDSCDISGSVRIQIFIDFHPADLKICLGESAECVGLLPYLLSIWSPHPEAANAASWCGIVITSLNLIRFKDLNVFIQQIRRSDWVKTMNIWDSPPFYS